eukprot:gene2906-1888_t
MRLLYGILWVTGVCLVCCVGIVVLNGFRLFCYSVVWFTFGRLTVVGIWLVLWVTLSIVFVIGYPSVWLVFWVVGTCWFVCSDDLLCKGDPLKLCCYYKLVKPITDFLIWDMYVVSVWVIMLDLCSYISAEDLLCYRHFTLVGLLVGWVVAAFCGFIIATWIVAFALKFDTDAVWCTFNLWTFICTRIVGVSGCLWWKCIINILGFTCGFMFLSYWYKLDCCGCYLHLVVLTCFERLIPYPYWLLGFLDLLVHRMHNAAFMCVICDDCGLFIVGDFVLMICVLHVTADLRLFGSIVTVVFTVGLLVELVTMLRVSNFNLMVVLELCVYYVGIYYNYFFTFGIDVAVCCRFWCNTVWICMLCSFVKYVGVVEFVYMLLQVVGALTCIYDACSQCVLGKMCGCSVWLLILFVHLLMLYSVVVGVRNCVVLFTSVIMSVWIGLLLVLGLSVAYTFRDKCVHNTTLFSFEATFGLVGELRWLAFPAGMDYVITWLWTGIRCWFSLRIVVTCMLLNFLMMNSIGLVGLVLLYTCTFFCGVFKITMGVMLLAGRVCMGCMMLLVYFGQYVRVLVSGMSCSMRLYDMIDTANSMCNNFIIF